jgi:phosphoheptose isomerase
VIEFREFAADYFERFRTVIERFPKEPLEQALNLIEGVRTRGGTLWVAGNGGSAAISDHLVCDATKGTHVCGTPPLRAISLASNNALLTALANDMSYAEVFSLQLEYYVRPEDAVLLISSSGNSPNVVAACEAARAAGIPTLALVGFDGGKLRGLADVVVWVPVDNYGITEDIHQSIMHCLTQFMRARAEAAPRTA